MRTISLILGMISLLAGMVMVYGTGVHNIDDLSQAIAVFALAIVLLIVEVLHSLNDIQQSHRKNASVS